MGEKQTGRALEEPCKLRHNKDVLWFRTEAHKQVVHTPLCWLETGRLWTSQVFGTALLHERWEPWVKSCLCAWFRLYVCLNTIHIQRPGLLNSFWRSSSLPNVISSDTPACGCWRRTNASVSMVLGLGVLAVSKWWAWVCQMLQSWVEGHSSLVGFIICVLNAPSLPQRNSVITTDPPVTATTPSLCHSSHPVTTATL